MTKSLDPFRFLLIAQSGWMNQQPLQLIDYLQEENRGCANNWAQRDYASTMASAADWPPGPSYWEKSFREVAAIVTPETLLAWHRRRRNKMAAENRTAADRENPRRSKIS